MNDSYGEINTLLKTQKNTKSNVLKERVIATQQKGEETGDTSCREKILSQDFRDFIIPNYRLDQELVYPKSQICVQSLGFGYRVAYVDQSLGEELSIAAYGYNSIPNCYALLDMEAMNETGISVLQNYPGLNLRGKGIMIGFLDTGIDYENEIFRNIDGSSRIAAIWDQTDQNGQPPDTFTYGSEYTNNQINQALKSDNPKEIVPVSDENGHGTFLASVAAGGENIQEGFTGAASEAEIAVVKLKEAKDYLRKFYGIRQKAVCYQETDIVQGLRYLHLLALKKQKPLVMCVALGTNLGGHNGMSSLSRILGSYSRLVDRCVVIGGGNEANERHHFQGKLNQVGEVQEVEMRVESGNTGFVAELWGTIPNIVTAYLISPSGERSPVISIRQGSRYQLTFPFEQTVVDVEYQLFLRDGRSQLLFLKFDHPAQGIWKIGVQSLGRADGEFHIWLPVREFLDGNVYFLEASPDVTLTEPANTDDPITVAYYRGADKSVDINSGRGYTRDKRIKPDFAVPGVQVLGAGVNGTFVRRSGSSVATGITAGACAMIMEWILNQPIPAGVTTSQVANIIILGAQQNTFSEFPNRQWGYGTMDLYQSLDRLRRL